MINAEELSEKIFKKQKEVDKLLGDLFKLDEQAHSEVCELLREENY